MTQTNSHKKAQSSQTFPISIRSLLCFSCAFSWPYHIKTRAVAGTEFGGRFRFKSTHFCLSALCFNLPKAVTTSDLNFSRAGFRLFPGFFCKCIHAAESRTKSSLTNVHVQKHQLRRFKVLIKQSGTRESLLCLRVLGEFVTGAP